jgi:hypothetical protein
MTDKRYKNKRAHTRSIIDTIQGKVCVVHPDEHNLQHTVRAQNLVLQEVRNELRKYKEVTNELAMELENDWSDVTPHYMLFKQRQFLHRMEVFGHCSLSGDVLGERTYINPCGHVFDMDSLENISPRLEKCPICSKDMVFKFVTKI